MCAGEAALFSAGADGTLRAWALEGGDEEGDGTPPPALGIPDAILRELRDMMGGATGFAVAPPDSPRNDRPAPVTADVANYRFMQRVASLRQQYPDCHRSQQDRSGEPCAWCRTAMKVAAHREIRHNRCLCRMCRSFSPQEGCEWAQRGTGQSDGENEDLIVYNPV